MRRHGRTRFRSWNNAAIDDAVGCANLPTLLLVLVHLTGDVGLIRGEVRPRRASPQRPDGDIGEGHAVEGIRERARHALRAFRDGAGALPPPPSRAVLAEMMSFSLGQEISPEYVSMLLEDTGLDGSARRVPNLAGLTASRDFHAIVIGAGIQRHPRRHQARPGRDPLYGAREERGRRGHLARENAYPGCRVICRATSTRSPSNRTMPGRSTSPA